MKGLHQPADPMRRYRQLFAFHDRDGDGRAGSSEERTKARGLIPAFPAKEAAAATMAVRGLGALAARAFH